MPKSNPHPAKITPQELQDLIYVSYQKKKPDILSKYNLTPVQYTGVNPNEQQVYLDQKGKPIVVFRGSSSKSLTDAWHDWGISDVDLALGREKYSPRFMRSQKLVEAVKKDYGKAPVTAIGHSLGGALAEFSNPTGHTITYNKGVGLGGIGKIIPSNQQDIRTAHDIVSALSGTQTHTLPTITVPKSEKIYNPITSHNPRQLANLKMQQKKI